MYTFRPVLTALLLTFSFSMASASGKDFRYTPQAREAYAKATSLRFGEAYALLSQIRLTDPGNLVVYHIENYIDFFKIYINEDEKEYKALGEKRDSRLEKIEQEGSPESPYYRFVQADIRLQWALAQLRFGDYFSAFTEVSKAHRLLQENQALHPEFLPNQKDLGILHAMVGTIPDSYKWGIKVLSGLRGTVEGGRSELQQVIIKMKDDPGYAFGQETYVLYALLMLHLEKEEDAAWDILRQAGLSPAENPLHCFLVANMAMRTGRNDKAVEVLEKRPSGPGFHEFPYLDYMHGLAKLRRLDKDAAPYFKRYIAAYNGRNFIKEAHQKLAWQALVNGDQLGYAKQMQTCLSVGYDVAGGDKDAQREAESGKPPHLALLKARLLFDGGYYLEGHELLQGLDAGQLGADAQLEYHYRMGRMLHGLERYPEALKSYQRAFVMGSESPLFFACNAALQMGLIYEELDKPQAAANAFERCLSLKPEAYRTGLHQQAKAGLSRLKG